MTQVLDPNASHGEDKIFNLYDAVAGGSNPGDIRVRNGTTLDPDGRPDRVKLAATGDTRSGLAVVAMSQTPGMVSGSTSKPNALDRKGRWMSKGFTKAKVRIVNGGGANDIAVWDLLQIRAADDSLEKAVEDAGTAGAVTCAKIVARALEASANAGGSPIEVLINVEFDGDSGLGLAQDNNGT